MSSGCTLFSKQPAPKCLSRRLGFQGPVLPASIIRERSLPALGAGNAGQVQLPAAPRHRRLVALLVLGACPESVAEVGDGQPDSRVHF